MKSLNAKLQNFNWHVIYTYPNLEKKVQTRLTERDIVSYLPLQKTIRQWSDRKKTLEIPLFPNYVFVYTNNYERFRINDIPGVARFVTFEGTPVVVSEREINLIKNVTVNCEVLVEESLKEGDKVEIIDGPLLGLTGVLFERKGKSRFGIKVDAIKQMVSIEISAAMVRKIEAILA